MKIKGWEYDYESLKKWDIHNGRGWCSDKITENARSDTACLIYSIGEVRMNTEMGFLAVFQCKAKPQLIINITNFMFPMQDPFYSNDGRYIILNAQIYIKAYNCIECPILILDMEQKKFANYKMKGNNYSYRFQEISPSRYMVQVDQYQLTHGDAENAEISIEKLEWVSFSDLEDYNKWI